MPRSFRRRRARTPLQLVVRAADPSSASQADPGPLRPALPGWARALAVGLGAGITGWLLVLVPVLLSWLADRSGGIGPVLDLTTQIWLLAHGGGLQIGEVRWTLAPLGITLLLLLLVALGSTLLVRSLAGKGLPTRAALLRLPAVVAGGYAAVVLMTALALGSPVQAGRAALGAVLLSGAGALWGAGRAADLGLLQLLPAWARCVPAAAGAAVGTVLLGGAAALGAGLVLHRERITAIADGLGAEGVSAVQLVVAQLAFLPNLLIWAASWVLGSGFSVGAGTVVSPPATDLGLLPSIPVLGALPAEGAADLALSWLIVGVAAGAVAGVVVLRRRPAARLEETAGAGLAAGLVALAAVTVLALLSRGDLGVGRLTNLGPRIPELLMLGGALLVVPAISVGVLGGIVRHWRGYPDAQQSSDSDEPTRVVGLVDDEDPTIRVGDRVGP